MTALAKHVDTEVLERKLLSDLEDAAPIARGSRSKMARARLRAVESMWIDMRETHEIVNEIVRAFNCEPRTVYTDLTKVREHHYISDELEKKNRSIQARAQWNEQRRAALADGDRKVAAFITDKLCKMDGLYAPIRTENVNVNITVDIAVDDIIDALAPHELDALLEMVGKFEAFTKQKLHAVIDVPSVEVSEPVLTTASEPDTDADE